MRNNHFWSEQCLKLLQAFKLRARSHFTETTLISIPFPLPLAIINLSGLGRTEQAAKTSTPSFPGKKTYTTHKPVFIPGWDLQQPALFPVPEGDSHLSSLKINHLHYRAERTHAHAHTGRHKYFPWQSRRAPSNEGHRHGSPLTVLTSSARWCTKPKP